MKKTIIITERQLHDILEVDISSLNKKGSEMPEFNGHTEISVGGKMGDNEFVDPITTDNYASKRYRNDNWGGTGKSRALMVNCNTDNKKKIVEANSAGKNRTWMIPDEIYAKLQQNLQTFNGDKNVAGYDRLNNLVNNRNVAYSEMKRLKGFFENDAKNDPNHFNLIGGNEMQSWVNNTLNTFRSSVESDKANRSAMGFQNVYQKAGGTKETGNGQAHTNKNITYQE